MNIELALQFDSEILSHDLSTYNLRGHAHIWHSHPFQGAFLRIPHIASILLGLEKKEEQFFLRKGSHPDILIFVDNGEIITVADAQRIVKHVSSAPQSGAHIIMIENIDRMGPESANILLKTIEEPSSNVHFLCSTEHVHNVLPTLLSRMTSHYIPSTHLSDEQLSRAISLWQLPWSLAQLQVVLYSGEELLYIIVEEYVHQKSTSTYDFLFELQSTYTDITKANATFFSAAKALLFLYDKKSSIAFHRELFFFTFEAYLAKLTMTYVAESNAPKVDKIRRIRKGLSLLKKDLKANMNKKLATHHFILSSLL